MFEPHKDIPVVQERIDQTRQRKQKNHLGTMLYRPGMKVWALDITIRKVFQVEMDETVVMVPEGWVKKREVELKPQYRYCMAISRSRAEYKLLGKKKPKPVKKPY